MELYRLKQPKHRPAFYGSVPNANGLDPEASEQPGWRKSWTAVRGTQATKGNSALLAEVSVVKGSTGQILGRFIIVIWLSTLFPLATFLPKYRHFHN